MSTASRQSQESIGVAPQQQLKLHYPALEGLRACAVLMVFVQHYFLAFIPGLWQWGWAGVDVFFVLSGFLITGILYDSKESNHRFRNFYIRRTLRIFPLYYGVLLVTFLLTPLMRWKWSVIWIYWPIYLENYVRFFYIHAFEQSHGALETLSSPVTFLHRPVWLMLDHFWTLSVEEQFYLCWPLVVFTVKNRIGLRNICLATIVILPFIRLVSVIYFPQELIEMEILYRVTPFRVDSLLLGGLLALILRGPEKRYLAQIIRWLVPICIVMLTAPPIVISMVLRHPVQLNATRIWMGSFGFTVIDLLSCCVIWISLQGDSSLFKFLTVKPLRKLGKISYGFYVFHHIPHVLYLSFATWLVGQRPLPALAVTFLVGFTATLILSLLSHRFFETPFLRLKDRYAPT